MSAPTSPMAPTAVETENILPSTSTVVEISPSVDVATKDVDMEDVSSPDKSQPEIISDLITQPSATNTAVNDCLFEPSVEMMVNDFDDERTLEEEEALAANEAEDPNAELSNLQREGDMPIEELLALYNCLSSAPPVIASSTSSGSSRRLSSRSRGSARREIKPAPVPKENVSENEKDTPTVSMDTTTEKENVVESNSVPSPINSNKEDEQTDIISDKQIEDKASPETRDYKTNQSNNNGEESVDSSTTKKEEEEKIVSGPILHPQPEVKQTVEDDEEEEDDEEDDEEEEESELRKLYPETFKNKDKRLLRASSRPHSEEEEEEEDGDYSPDEDEFKKTIMVGSEFQAQIPEGLCRYDDALPYENEDKLVWDPSQLNENDIELYLQKVCVPNANSNGSGDPNSSPTNSINVSSIVSVTQIPCGAHLRDDEQSLYLLLQCGHNTEEALRRRRLNAGVPTAVAVAAAATASSGPSGNDSRMSLWSEEECRNFESGLRIYGKDFHAIQQSKVRTRAVGELVQFYYLWKKTERHDVFANKARLEKKKYNLHPGLTDYMDRFLEEQENNGPNGGNVFAAGGSGSNGGSNGHIRDRSSSPGVNCLLYNDFKRQRTNNYTTSTLTSTATNSTVTSAGNACLKQVTALNDPLAMNDIEVFSSSQNRNNYQNNHAGKL